MDRLNETLVKYEHESIGVIITMQNLTACLLNVTIILVFIPCNCCYIFIDGVFVFATKILNAVVNNSVSRNVCTRRTNDLTIFSTSVQEFKARF